MLFILHHIIHILYVHIIHLTHILYVHYHIVIYIFISYFAHTGRNAHLANINLERRKIKVIISINSNIVLKAIGYNLSDIKNSVYIFFSFWRYIEFIYILRLSFPLFFFLSLTYSPSLARLLHCLCKIQLTSLNNLALVITSMRHR